MIAPDDVDIIKEGGEARRKFFDTAISQLDKKYLDDLIQYNHALKQRNSLLRMFSESGNPDWLAIESYDDILCRLGKVIFERRKNFVKEFLPIFRKYFSYIVEAGEICDLQYSSELAEAEIGTLLMKSRQRDLALQRTCCGVHRDDYLFTLGNGDLRRLGSQGQQKSFVIAWKLAHFEMLEKHNGFKPILLLDDIFDKLDDYRITKLLQLIKSDLGQLFITDARPGRTVDLLRSVGVVASIFKVDDGNVTCDPTL
jgi:DNA replication and repair protein RecF